VGGELRDPVQIVLDWGRRYALWVLDLGLACCAVEFVAAATSGRDFLRLGALPGATGPATADVLVVSGTVTDALAPAVRRLYDAMPGPRSVISFGSCASSGGPYWDSYSVTKGVDQLVPVDVYVPGCPPRPEALLQGLLRLHELAGGTAPAALAGPPDGGATLVSTREHPVGPADLRARPVGPAP